MHCKPVYAELHILHEKPAPKLKVRSATARLREVFALAAILVRQIAVSSLSSSEF
jgi:hypothetical protein